MDQSNGAAVAPALEAIPTARAWLEARRELPDGVILYPLKTHPDERGNFTELFREEWKLAPRAVQWNMVRSSANVMRGVHVHRKHTDMLTMAAGEMILGLHDVRRGSTACGATCLLRLQAQDLHLVVIPAGVAHGFYFAQPSTHIYAVSHEFDGSDEFGCRWDDAALNLNWPCSTPLLSTRDGGAGSYASMVAAAGLGVNS